MDLLQSLTIFAGQFVAGMYPLPPDAGTLRTFAPDLSMIPRDAQGIIGQQQDDPQAPLDGGDSAHKTGVTAFCNSAQDQALLPVFESGGIMVRHPSQAPWNNWKNCSRDQLMAYTAGCWRAAKLDINSRLLAAHASRFPPYTCQNTENDAPGTTKNPPIGDPLAPHDVMALRIASGESAAYMDLLGQFSLQVAIELADPSVDVEKNQLILTSIICGRLDLYVQVHPNFRENIHAYWSGWRKQRQIGEAFISVIEKELERYAGRVVIPILPAHLIAFFRSIDVGEELRNFSPAHIAQLGLRFMEASLRDHADMLVNGLKIGVHAAVNRLKAIGVAVDQIASSLAHINQVPNAIRAALGAAGFPADAISRAMQGAFPGIPHVDQLATPHIDQAAVPHNDIAPVHNDVGAVHSDIAGVHMDATAPHLDADLPFGGHTDEGGGHADSTGSHTDIIVAPHTDLVVTPHVDEGPTAHVDVPPQGHIDTP